jgi:hypothetical protein
MGNGKLLKYNLSFRFLQFRGHHTNFKNLLGKGDISI